MQICSMVQKMAGMTIEIRLLDDGALRMDETLGVLKEDLVAKNLS